MARKTNIKQFTAEELAAKAKRGESLSDWAKADALTEDALEAAIKSDPDEADLIFDWSKATIEMPQAKACLNMRIDKDVLEFFRNTGRGYQSKINAILRTYVEQKKQQHNRL